MRNLKLVGSNVTYLRPAAAPMIISDEGPTMIRMVKLCDECCQVPVAEVWKEKKCDDCLRRIFNRSAEREQMRRTKRMFKEMFWFGVAVLVAIGLAVLFGPHLTKLFR